MTVLLMLFSLLWLINQQPVTAAPPPMVLPNCREKCGNVSIPYPFGMGEGCYYNESFAITCNQTSQKPFLSKFNMTEVLEIVLEDGLVKLNNPIPSNCPVAGASLSTDFRGSPFKFSADYNQFTMVGCDNALLAYDGQIMAGCMSSCTNDIDTFTATNATGCYGINCCQTSIPLNLGLYNITVGSKTREICTYAFLVETTWFLGNFSTPYEISEMKNVPVVMTWRPQNSSWVRSRSPGYDCFFPTSQGYYDCSCGCVYEGNPYIPNGCKVVEACTTCEKECVEGPREGEFFCNSKAAPPSMVLPNCTEMCGNVSIPYPFGMGIGCYYNESFAITCNQTFQKPFLSKFNTTEVLEIELEYSLVKLNNPIPSNCPVAGVSLSTDFRGSPFKFSGDYNRFTVVGCDNALLTYDGQIMVGCTSSCTNTTNTGDIDTFTATNPTNCDGINCCQTSIPHNLGLYNITIGSKAVENCTYAFLVETNWFHGKFSTPYEISEMKNVPVVMTWRQNSIQQTSSWARSSNNKTKIILGSSLGGGLLFLVLCGFCFWLYKIIKKRRIMKLKQKFFKRNGGLLLQQQISSDDEAVEKTIVFTSKELEKATDNFNENRILGQGGQGTVYKGMRTDGKIVAIKKSKAVDESQLKPFINEVVILSQINHRNIVKLLGCCLETEVPLLVYEYISNGNLFQLIHDQSEEYPLSWKMRVQIATEVAGSLAYLHSASSIPIYHRDIKSTNILLDDKYRAKVSDFGTSRSIAIEQTHLTTLVHGTFGYLDPEYFQSSQFTEKSDVYSFGVVLVELLTGQKPISSVRSEEEKSLATRFILYLKDDRLFDLLDSHVIKEAGKEEIIVVANIAKRCINLSGKKRPTMKEVMMELEGIRMSHIPLKENSNEDEFMIVEMKGPIDDASTSTQSVSDYGRGFSSYVDPLLLHTS